MKSLKSAARRGSIIAAAGVSALALSACSAGQVTQTADQVAAVDGNFAASTDPAVSVRDVTVLLNDVTGEAALKFGVSNEDYSGEPVTLESVTVDGQDVEMDAVDPIGQDCVLIADTADNLEAMPQADEDIACIQYTETSLENEDFPYAGNVPVVFSFDFGDIELDATVAAHTLPAGEADRDYSTPGPA